MTKLRYTIKDVEYKKLLKNKIYKEEIERKYQSLFKRNLDRSYLFRSK